MKSILILVCFLFALVLAQNNCTAPVNEDCGTCTSMSGCNYCTAAGNGGHFFACLPGPAVCAANNLTVVTQCSTVPPNNLTVNANYQCTSGTNATSGSTATVYTAFDERVYFTPTHADIVAHFSAFAGITTPGNPPLLGFQYFAAAGNGNPETNNFMATDYGGLGAFWSMLSVVEFLPGPNDNGAFNPNTAQFFSLYNFTSFVIQPCNQQISGSTTVNYITFQDPQGWKINCRFSNDPTLDPTGHPISPVATKCDLTIGNYNYIRTDTYLGFFTIFYISGFSIDVKVVPTVDVHPCSSDPQGSFCLTTTSSAYVGQFAYANQLTSGKKVVATGVSAYNSGAAQASAGAPPGQFGSGNNSVVVNVKEFAAASFTVFSVLHPAAGDVWDPTLSMAQGSVVDGSMHSSHKSSATTVTYSLFLILAALLLNYKNYY